MALSIGPWRYIRSLAGGIVFLPEGLPQGESQIMMKCDLLVAEGELTIGEAIALGEDRLWRSLDLIL